MTWGIGSQPCCRPEWTQKISSVAMPGWCLESPPCADSDGTKNLYLAPCETASVWTYMFGKNN